MLKSSQRRPNPHWPKLDCFIFHTIRTRKSSKNLIVVQKMLEQARKSLNAAVTSEDMFAIQVANEIVSAVKANLEKN